MVLELVIFVKVLEVPVGHSRFSWEKMATKIDVVGKLKVSGKKFVWRVIKSKYAWGLCLFTRIDKHRSLSSFSVKTRLSVFSSLSG